MKPATNQLSLFPAPRACHHRRCRQPVVGSSIAKRDTHVCREHNELEWARALSRSRGGWREFGRARLARLGAA